MAPKSGLSVQSFFSLWTVLTLSDAAVPRHRHHHEVSISSSGTVEHHRPKATQLIRKESSNPISLQEDREHFDLLVLIPASFQRDQGRLQTIRDTWTRDLDTHHRCRRCDSQRTVKYLFMLGEEAVEEDVHGGDIVVLPRCSSSYEQLASKVRRSIHYAVQHYSFNLLLKADTDSWIFLDRLLQFAEDHHLFDSRRSAQAGEVRRKGRPQGSGRNPDGVFTKLTGQETYPVYSPGCGYLLTRNLCNYISLLASEEDSDAGATTEASLPALQDLPQEDVSVGFWLEAVEHEHISMPLSIMGDACSKPNGQSMVLDHYVSEEEMRRRWRNLQRSGDPCEVSDDDEW